MDSIDLISKIIPSRFSNSVKFLGFCSNDCETVKPILPDSKARIFTSLSTSYRASLNPSIKSRSPPPLDSRTRHCSFAPRSFLFSHAVSTPRTRQQCGPLPHPPLSIDLIVSHREQAGQLSQRGQRITTNTRGLDNKPCPCRVPPLSDRANNRPTLTFEGVWENWREKRKSGRRVELSWRKGGSGLNILLSVTVGIAGV